MRTSNDRWTSPEERYAVTMSLKLCRNFLDDFDAVGAVAVSFLPALRMALARASIHRGARTLLVVKPESPRELSSALTGRLEISTATTIRHSEPLSLTRWSKGTSTSPETDTPPCVDSR